MLLDDVHVIDERVECAHFREQEALTKYCRCIVWVPPAEARPQSWCVTVRISPRHRSRFLRHDMARDRGHICIPTRESQISVLPSIFEVRESAKIVRWNRGAVDLRADTCDRYFDVS